MKRPIRVLIAIPTGNTPQMEFTTSLFNLLRTIHIGKDIGLVVSHEGSALVAYNRNKLIKYGKELDVTHILFIDDDMVFPADTFHRLMSHNKDIVGATASLRGDDDGKPIGVPMSPDSFSNPRPLMKMQSMGACCMLIKMGVFERTGLPAFYDVPNPGDGNVHGEDVGFCMLAIKNGYDVWLDWELSKEIGHVGRKIFYIKPSR